MGSNVPVFERIIRIILAIVVAALGYYTIYPLMAYILYVIAGILFITAIISWCPCNAALGRGKRSRYSGLSKITKQDIEDAVRNHPVHVSTRPSAKASKDVEVSVKEDKPTPKKARAPAKKKTSAAKKKSSTAAKSAPTKKKVVKKSPKASAKKTTVKKATPKKTKTSVKKKTPAAKKSPKKPATKKKPTTKKKN